MKIRDKSKAEKIEPQMAPMIDVVFQLLIFFMLTLKIVEPEGDFNINMPVGQPQQGNPDEQNLPDIKVRMTARPDGSLQMLYFGEKQLGSNEGAFVLLNDEIGALISAGGEALRDEIEIEIDAAYNLHMRYTISAIGACTGKKDGDSVVKYVEKIKFTPPKRPES